jgi:uncharacterized membrane protein
MTFQFTHPLWLLALLPALIIVIWLGWKSDIQIGAWRHWTALVLRTIIVTFVILALAGLQWKKPLEGMNVFYLLDRSQSIPAPQLEQARAMVNALSKEKKPTDKAGVLVFGADAAIESSPAPQIDLREIQAVIGNERTDIGAAIRLGTAAFPENGQRRLVLISDGNENVGDAMAAVSASLPLGVSLDVIPIGATRGNDVSVRKLGLPSSAKKGQPFDIKIFAQADREQSATIRLIRNEQVLGSQKVDLAAGKNLFTFPQVLNEPGFYSYRVEIDAPGDTVPQNNRATAFTTVRGNPRILIVSSAPAQDVDLVKALKTGELDIKISDKCPNTLAEMQSYDTIFISNMGAGDIGRDSMLLLESAVRDFGVGLVCIGGDQAYAAGGYRGTPLEAALPVDMELNSKKVLPSGALAIVCHATEFLNGNQWARDIAFAALEALGPQDQMGIILWDGTVHWVFELAKVGDKKEMGRLIAGMNPGDMGDFQAPMEQAFEALKKSSANLKHMVVFSDGDPGGPTDALLQDIIKNRITISTVMIGGHTSPEKMAHMADVGHGKFWPVDSADDLPQIFIKEAAVILKSAIFEEPFKPKMQLASETVKGISQDEFPQLRGYVCTTPKSRAEVPLVTHKGDPLLAQWQYGLGRSVAFTSDAKARWAKDWLAWDKYRQFWLQIAQWSLRRVEANDFTSEVSVEKGEGHLSVEAVDAKGNYRNFLNLQAMVVSPKGDKQVVHLEQTGPGHYEVKFPTKQVGSYLINLTEGRAEESRGQTIGLSVNYSPEFDDAEPNVNLLRHLAEASGGKVLDPLIENPFTHDRKKTFQPQDLWEWLLKISIILFVIDIGIRRIQLDHDQWLRATATLRRYIFFWQGVPKPAQADESLAALLNRRDHVRAQRPTPITTPVPDLFTPENPPEVGRAFESAGAGTPVSTHSPDPAPAPEKPAPAKPAESTTSRLLDAKRRARERSEGK